MKIKRQVIRTHQPFRAVVVLLVTAGLAAGGTFAYHLRQRSDLEARRAASAREQERLEGVVAGLALENGALRKRLAETERAQQVERKAYRDLDEHLQQLQSRVLGLKEEVAFYRGIVSSADRAGLSIQNLLLDRDAAERAYRFQVVLTRDIKSDKVVDGTVSLAVAGEQDGEPRSLSHEDLSGPGAQALEFSFKYFQRLEGRFTLPPGFVPRRVHVRVDAPRETPSRLERTFDWPNSVS